MATAVVKWIAEVFVASTLQVFRYCSAGIFIACTFIRGVAVISQPFKKQAALLIANHSSARFLQGPFSCRVVDPQ